MTRMVIGIILLTLLSCSTNNDRVPASVNRPPQYILLSFDGSKNLNMWQNILDFSQDMEREGKSVKFTFFVSGTYFVTREDKRLYTPQGQTIYWKGGRPVIKNLGAGDSAIGWADSKEGIAQRIKYMNRAIREGHEIGSHAVGHWDGGFKDSGIDTRWSHATWMNEFQNFNNLVFNWKRNNHIGGEDLNLSPNEVVGFRAPQLGVSSGLWTTLKNFKYSYDTSESGNYRSWPVIGPFSGAWNIKLGEIPITNSSKYTIAMDYNFYVRHKQQSDPSTLKFYEDQVYESYMNYFYQSYYGNRAPVIIGHHFSLWNNGIYWNAYKRFARTVCGQSEVECINYKDFSNRMSRIGQQSYANYREGNFSKMRIRKAAQPEYLKITSRKIYDLDTHFSAYDKGVTLSIDGKDKKLSYQYEFSFNGKKISGKKLHDIGKFMKENKLERALIGARVLHKKDEVSVETRAIKVNSDGSVKLAEKSLEESLKNDHQLAHEGNLDQMMDDYLKNSIE